MATALARPISFTDIGLNDQDQDGNSALLELDRGLKSTRTGEQCEAISKFPALFEKYPFPILINSALLKLAEVFRQETPGSNFVRVCVVEVVESCGRHLDKLINVDEFLRRITTVMHSNDPLARALTLRTLGWMSGVVGENRRVQHLIREALDAKESVELQAAIMAAEKYAAKSKTFAMNMCDRLIHMIGGLATPVDVKLQLIQVFQHMHHDAETAATVRSLCLELLKEYPTQRVVITTLHTLTQLAAHILVDIPQQVDLLIGNLEGEARLGVRQAVLGELGFLAEAAPHAWSADNVETLVKFTKMPHHSPAMTTTSLSVLASLTAAPTLPRITLTPDCALVDLCRECVYDSNIKVACRALQLFTNIAVYMYEEQKTLQLCEEAHCAAINLLQSVFSSSQQEDLSSPTSEEYVPPGLRSCLVCAVLLSQTLPTIMNDLAVTLTHTLSDNTLTVCSCQLVCETLASLGGSRDVLTPHLPPVLKLVQKLTLEAPLNAHKTKLMVTLVTLVLQVFHGHVWSNQAEAAVVAASKCVNQWAAFCIARQASRYGHHNIAAGLYGVLSWRVCSDQQHFWVSALAEVSQGEAYPATSGDRADNLTAANTHLLRALSALKASSSPNQPMNFCQEYVKLRAETFMCHAQLLHACLSLRTAPPPAIAASLATSTRDDLLRCGRVSQQLTKSARDFNTLASQYGTLYQSVFDADPQTLCNLALLQQGALLVAQGIEIITRPSAGQLTEDYSGPDLTTITSKLGGGESIETQSIISTLEEATALVRRLAQVSCEVKPVREQHLQLLQGISQVLTSVPLPYPRFFFQTLQKTTITLALLPQPRAPGDPISVQTSSQLALKVEGVIGHGKRPGLFRSVRSVTLTVNSSLTSRPQHSTLDLKSEPNETLTQTVEPHNDFFAAQFLLGFPIPGMYQVSVDTSVTDDSDDAWQTGPRHTLHVKSQEDPASKTNVSQVSRQVPPSQYAPSTSQVAPGPPPPGVGVLPPSQTGANTSSLPLPQYNIPRPGT
ncbi:integrator complex subunit 7-like [Eriocheir sinensis]|uniref:integrator complex subunit 7-like n=1 Tax=Eriocheir sinensis TaxID=95602 RepID=UPI0021C89827|nr:integrator complex subunit 7-like [Eriocheir sinensis]